MKAKADGRNLPVSNTDLTPVLSQGQAMGNVKAVRSLKQIEHLRKEKIITYNYYVLAPFIQQIVINYKEETEERIRLPWFNQITFGCIN